MVAVTLTNDELLLSSLFILCCCEVEELFVELGLAVEEVDEFVDEALLLLLLLLVPFCPRNRLLENIIEAFIITINFLPFLFLPLITKPYSDNVLFEI